MLPLEPFDAAREMAATAGVAMQYLMPCRIAFFNLSA